MKYFPLIETITLSMCGAKHESDAAFLALVWFGNPVNVWGQSKNLGIWLITPIIC
jgi:hypothetical protein